MRNKLFLGLIGLVLFAIIIDVGIILGLFTAAKSLQAGTPSISQNLLDTPDSPHKDAEIAEII